jgi:hypothetical protein
MHDIAKQIERNDKKMIDIVKRLQDKKRSATDEEDDALDEILSLRQQLDMFIAREKVWSKAINSRDEHLAECQAREKVRQGELSLIYEMLPTSIKCNAAADAIEKLLALPFDPTALDTLKKKWQRGALLEAKELLLRSCPFGSNPQAWYVNEIEQKVKELE